MEELTIDEEMIKTKLDNLNVCKSVGPDGVHPRLLKELSNHLCKPIARLFNNSLAVVELPKEWKQGRISAIFKKGNRKNAGNYRPVSLTGIICKCMEQCIKDHIVNHMIRNQLFRTQQFGFIKSRSTVLKLLNVIDSWTKALDRREYVDVYLDFTKVGKYNKWYSTGQCLRTDPIYFIQK